jgi:hypothetical protein
MAETDVKIVVEIKNYIEQNGGNYPHWYVGLAKYPGEKLITHGVNPSRGYCIYITAECKEDAHSAVQYFIEHFGTNGDTGEHNDDYALSVYAYRKTASTHP